MVKKNRFFKKLDLEFLEDRVVPANVVYSWAPTTGNLWSTPGNWTKNGVATMTIPGVTGNTDVIVFDNVNATLEVDANYQVGGFTVQDPTGGHVISPDVEITANHSLIINMASGVGVQAFYKSKWSDGIVTLDSDAALTLQNKSVVDWTDPDFEIVSAGPVEGQLNLFGFFDVSTPAGATFTNNVDANIDNDGFMLFTKDYDNGLKLGHGSLTNSASGIISIGNGSFSVDDATGNFQDINNYGLISVRGLGFTVPFSSEAVFRAYPDYR